MEEGMKQKAETQLQELKQKLFELNLTVVFQELVDMGFSSVDSLKMFDSEALEFLKSNSKTRIPFLQLKLLSNIVKDNAATFHKQEVDYAPKRHKPTTNADDNSQPTSSTANTSAPSSTTEPDPQAQTQEEELEEQLQKNRQKIASAISHIEKKCKKGRWKDCQIALQEGKLKPSMNVIIENSDLFFKCQCNSERTTKVKIRVRTDRKEKRKNGSPAQNLDYSNVKEHILSHASPPTERNQRSLSSYYFLNGRP